MLTNMRVGAAGGTVTVNGGEHILNGISAANFVLTGTSIIMNVQCPSNNITDTGTGNTVSKSLTSFTPVWTASGTAPSFGNSTVYANWSKSGSRISVVYDITFGSTATYGTGYWMFSLPETDIGLPVDVGGVGFTQGVVAGTDIMFIPRGQGSGIVRLYSVVGGSLSAIGGASRTWAAGDLLRFSFEYYRP